MNAYPALDGSGVFSSERGGPSGLQYQTWDVPFNPGPLGPVIEDPWEEHGPAGGIQAMGDCGCGCGGNCGGPVIGYQGYAQGATYPDCGGRCNAWMLEAEYSAWWRCYTAANKIPPGDIWAAKNGQFTATVGGSPVPAIFYWHRVAPSLWHAGVWLTQTGQWETVASNLTTTEQQQARSKLGTPPGSDWNFYADCGPAGPGGGGKTNLLPILLIGGAAAAAFLLFYNPE
jgi:hypothetical protein